MSTPVVAVLWDADGVLQRVPAGWDESMRPALEGRVEDVDAALAQTFWEERPSLTGEVGWLEALPGLLERWGIPQAYEDFVRTWLTIEPVPESRALVAGLRRSGVRCYLASNQAVERASYMQAEMGYVDLLDGCFFSHDLRAAKPEPAFFTRILQRLDLAPEQVLFVDDNAGNVEAARELGLAAETWSHRDGVEALRDHLHRHGLP